jgi:nucleotide-binding universal stress UspA family protein
MSTVVDSGSIVVGVDGSDSSLQAAHWAAATAKRLGAPLVVLHAVYEPVYSYGDGAILALAEIEEHLRRTGNNIVREAVIELRRMHPAVQIEAELVHGRPDLNLLELSKRARLIVVGSDGNSSRSVILGSTALHVANHASCPVVIWRSIANQPVPFGLPVVVGVDGSELSAHAVAAAFEFASLFGVTLIAGHSWTRSSHGDETDRVEGQVLAESLAACREKYPDVQVELVAKESNAAALLLELAHTAQLVVVGSHGRGRLAAMLLGSTTQNLVHHLACPILICRGTA